MGSRRQTLACGHVHSENGLAPLRRHFATVERRDTDGQVLWETREALQSYLDAYRDAGSDESSRGTVPIPSQPPQLRFGSAHTRLAHDAPTPETHAGCKP